VTVTETRHQPGQWDLTLSRDTPADIVALFNTRDPGGFGTIVITEGFRSGIDLDPTTLLSVSKYTGVFTQRDTNPDGTWKISGPGLLALLGSDDSGGQASYVLMDEASGSDDHNLATWAGLVINGGTVATAPHTVTWAQSPLNLRAAFNPPTNPLLAYGITAPGDTRYLSRRAILEWLVVQYGIEYRVFPDATISVGLRGFIYDDSIRPIVADGSGPDPARAGIRAGLGGTEDLEDYAYRVYLRHPDGNYYLSSANDVRYRDPFGRNLVISRHVEVDVPKAWNQALVDVYYGQTVEPHRVVNVTPGDQVDVDAQLEAGGYLNVYAPDQGILDVNNGMLHRGGWIYPTAARLESITWPVVDGMGVYFRWWPTSSAPQVVDLTRYVVNDTGSTTLALGGLPHLIRTHR
jgi:hypothetical protein